ncbi:MAG TPA: (2Fe-2S) ferredoxin domain-containing protein [Polyangiaceae bacterium]|nr:(2Fe-2S) ferredoxin domain-containing protein [Polyangiaceae bacterium]
MSRTARRKAENRVRSPIPQRKRFLFVCVNRRPDGTPKGSCAARGAVEIHARLKELLKKRGLAELEVRACTSSCLDVCWAGPSIAVEPDHFVYGRVREEDVEAIVDGLVSGERVERLVLAARDFEMPRELREQEMAGKKPV